MIHKKKTNMEKKFPYVKISKMDHVLFQGAGTDMKK